IESLAPKEDGHTACVVERHSEAVPRRGTAYDPLGPGGPVPFPGLGAATWNTCEAPEQDSHAECRVVVHRVVRPWRRTSNNAPGRVIGHRMCGPRRGTADDALAPRSSIPFPSLTVEVGAVIGAPKENGHVSSRVVSHRVLGPW